VIAFLVAPGGLEAKPAKPFKARMTGTDTLVLDPTCPAGMRSIITGRGSATHLGKFTVILQDCVVPVLPNFLFVGGTFVAVAADGSELTGTYEGQLLATATTLFDIEGSYVVTGGTGRFEGATGSGSFTGTDDIVTHDVELSLVGTITP
jgi:hypothetical protein